MSLTSTMSTPEVLNIEELLARCMGNIDFAARLVAKFQDRCEEDLSRLDRAILVGDVEEAATIAHRIKGAAASVAAHPLHACSAEIERWGRAGRLTDIVERVEQLHREWSRFINQASTLDLTARDMS